MSTRIRHRPLFTTLVPATLAALLLAGCSGSDAATPATDVMTTSSAPSSGAGVVVPGLDGSAGVDVGGVTVPGVASASAPVTTTVEATASMSPPTDPITGVATGEQPPPTAAAAPPTTEIVTPVDTPAPPATSAAPPTTSEAPIATTPPPTTSAAPPTSVAPTGQVLTVELTGCEGCEVIASQESVVGGRSAALISRSGRGAVVSVDAGGQVVGVANIPYGASFPTPAGGLLPCDAAGRCVITAEQADGTAVLSVFSLDGAGRWTDLSGDSGYPSSTAEAQAVDVGGELGLAVQDSLGDLTVWMVLSWSGTEFTVDGCAPDGAVPSAGDLDPELCLS